MKMPCETTVWNVLPVIRRELAVILVEEYGLSQAEVARRFDLTEAAISQYMKKKRGSMDFNVKGFKKQISMSAEIISEDPDPKKLAYEICRLCQLIRNSSCWEAISAQKIKKND
jgi:predicted transcriptional regulator